MINYIDPFYIDECGEKKYHSWYRLAAFCKFGGTYRVDFLKNVVDFDVEDLNKYVNDGLFKMSCANGGTSVKLTDKGFSILKLASEKDGIKLEQIRKQ